jgi:NAD(P)H-nitrite reductase large subunit
MDTKEIMDNKNETVCYCSDIDRQQIIEAVKTGANTLQKVRDATGACTIGNCIKMNPQKRCCSKDILPIIKIYELARYK